MIAMRRVDLPQPDSPTRPKLSPGMMSSEKSGKATTEPEEDRYSTLRSRMESSGFVTASRSSIRERQLAQAVGEQVEAEHERDDGEAGEQRHVREHRDHGGRLLDHAAPVRVRRRQAESQEAEGADGDGGVAEPEAEIGDQRPAAIGQELDQHDVGIGLAAEPRRGDEILLL